MKQWIDIIIPAYNAHSTLGKTLASIAIQTMAHEVRVIIIDDHSKTGYEDIIAPYKNILDIVLITNKENLGCGASRNIGLENAKNKYIAKYESSINKINFNGLFASSWISFGISSKSPFLTSIILNPSLAYSFTIAFTVDDLPVPASPYKRTLAAGFPFINAYVLSIILFLSLS